MNVDDVGRFSLNCPRTQVKIGNSATLHQQKQNRNRAALAGFGGRITEACSENQPDPIRLKLSVQFSG